jgi:epoxyqueuosine reductase
VTFSPDVVMEFLKAEAEALGFFLIGVSELTTPEHFPQFQEWVDHGLHAGMSYLARTDTLIKRNDPSLIQPGACTLISLAIPYQPAQFAPPSLEGQSSGRVAAYAWGPDYHEILPAIMHNLMERLHLKCDLKFRYSVHTDSAPILEREFAARAGLGWIGKNTCLIHPKFGSYFLLAEILTDLILPGLPQTVSDHCGTCERCIQACPTGCIRSDRTLDASRCISYLTIENKVEIPPELQPKTGNWVFGCDLCQVVCPWNQSSSRLSQNSPLQFDPELAWVNLAEELGSNVQEFEEKYQHRPIRRARHLGWLRNCIVAAGNSPSKELINPLVFLMETHPSPVIRTQAAYALSNFTNPDCQSAFCKALENETNPQVMLILKSLVI